MLTSTDDRLNWALVSPVDPGHAYVQGASFFSATSLIVALVSLWYLKVTRIMGIIK